MSRTVALPAGGLGWGRWITIRSPSLLSPTLDPERSTSSTPQALSSDSMSSHRISASVDFWLTRANVLLCFALNTHQSTTV